MSILDQINIKKIRMSDHAYERAAERLKLKDKTEAVGVIRKKLLQSENFGLTPSEDGSLTYMFACKNGEVFHINEKLDCITTLYVQEKIRHTPLKSTIESIHRKELRKNRRREQALKKRIALRKLELNSELWATQLREAKTRSNKVRSECQFRINEIEIELVSQVKAMESELNNLLDQSTQLARFIVSLQ